MSDLPAQPELAFVETDALVEELERRFRATLIVTCRDAEHADPDDDERAYYYSGGHEMAVYLADWAKHRIHLNRDKASRGSSEE